jgi:uncharacterized membrane protein YvbJ
MYCISCGNQIATELNYCNRCGTKVLRAADPEQKRDRDALSNVLGASVVFGLIGFIFVALVLVRANVPEKTLVTISVFYLAALFGICFMILRQIRKDSNKLSGPGRFQNERLDHAATSQLNAHQTPIGSVTENTTKTLNSVLIEK